MKPKSLLLEAAVRNCFALLRMLLLHLLKIADLRLSRSRPFLSNFIEFGVHPHVV